MPTIQEIQGWLAANPTATDADIRTAMDQYGVSPELMAQATGLGLADVQSRYTSPTSRCRLRLRKAPLQS